MRELSDPPPRLVEEACLNGWPALRQIVRGGLLLRFSDGYTRRANSVNPIGPLAGAAEDAIRFCENTYRQQGLPTIFRLSSAWDQGLGPALDRAGYAPPEDETLVLLRAVKPSPDRMAGVRVPTPTTVTPRPDTVWLDALARIQGHSERIRSTHRQILGAIASPAGFASVTVDGQIVALCFGAVHDGIVCVNSVATDPGFRRMGLARTAIEAVAAWAKHEAGAAWACVPVVPTMRRRWRSIVASASSANCCAITTGAGWYKEPAFIETERADASFQA